MPQPHRATLRVVQVLNYVRTHSETGAALAEIAQAFDIPKSSLLPIMHTLRDEQFLTYEPATQRYRIGFSAYEVGQGYVRGNSSLLDIRAEMEKITETTGETCYFGELRGGDVVYLLSVESPQPIRMVASVGNTLPAYSASIGKALLSDSTLDDLKQMYPDGLKRITSHTITDIHVLTDQLTDIKATGVAYETEESTPGIRCAAVPLMVNGKIRAAISVATPLFRTTDERMAFIVGVLKREQPKLQRILTASSTVN